METRVLEELFDSLDGINGRLSTVIDQLRRLNNTSDDICTSSDNNIDELIHDSKSMLEKVSAINDGPGSLVDVCLHIKEAQEEANKNSRALYDAIKELTAAVKDLKKD